MHSVLNGPFEGAYRPSPQVTTSLEQGRVDDSVLLTIGNILEHLKLLHFEYCWNAEQFYIQNQFGVYSGSCPDTCNKVITPQNAETSSETNQSPIRNCKPCHSTLKKEWNRIITPQIQHS